MGRRAKFARRRDESAEKDVRAQKGLWAVVAPWPLAPRTAHLLPGRHKKRGCGTQSPGARELSCATTGAATPPAARTGSNHHLLIAHYATGSEVQQGAQPKADKAFQQKLHLAAVIARLPGAPLTVWSKLSPK